MKFPGSQEIRLQKKHVYPEKWRISLKIGQIVKMKNKLGISRRYWETDFQ
jgi:hypothetical protein